MMRFPSGDQTGSLVSKPANVNRVLAPREINQPKGQSRILRIEPADGRPAAIRSNSQRIVSARFFGRPESRPLPVKPYEPAFLFFAGSVNEKAIGRSRKVTAVQEASHLLGDRHRLARQCQSPRVERLRHQLP